jgi:hypothetical protein
MPLLIDEQVVPLQPNPNPHRILLAAAISVAITPVATIPVATIPVTTITVVITPVAISRCC